MTRTCLCGDESRPNSWLCAECAKTASKCESCGVPMIDHPGLYATCAELQRVKKENAKLLDTLRQIEAQVTPGDYDAHWSAIRMAGIAKAALQEDAQCQP